MTMKYTHLPLSISVVLLVWFIGGNALWAWLGITAVWASREWTQAEYRYIEHIGDGSRASMPWWGGFDPKAWTFKSLVMDMVLPGAVGLGLAIYLNGVTL